MGNELTKTDFLLFLKKNYKKIFVVAFLVSVLSVGYLLYTGTFSGDKEESETEESVSGPNASIDTLLEIDEEELTTEEAYRLEQYLKQGAYQFSMFIENEDSKSFNRSNLLEEFLTEEDVVNEIETTLGYNLEPSAEQIIETEYNSANVLMTVYFRTGDLETSKEIANAYYTYIENDNLELFRNRTVYFLDTPEPVEQEANESIEQTNELDETESAGSNLVTSTIKIIFLVLISLVFGAIFGVIGIVVISYFSKKISSLYNYELNEKDISLNLVETQTDKTKAVLQAILYPPVGQKLILVEDESSMKSQIEEWKEMITQEGQKLEVVSSVTNVDPRLNFEEIVLITEVGKTTKKWYREQANQLKMYHAPKKIIKV